MQILSSYPSNNTVQNSKTDDIDTTAETKSKDKETAESTNKFSSRAEKFSQLNKEFDIKAGNFKITDKFINRLNEMDLLTDSQASKLRNGLDTETKSTDSLNRLDSKINALTKRIKEETGVESLISILNKSQDILKNLDGSKSKSFPIDPATAGAELDHFLKSDKASILTNDEKNSVKDLQVALAIADKLNPEQRTSAEIGKYMEILNNYRYK
jgi:hypothetical protein